ncbi:DUF362 domain-containing protein [Candidatus Bathyarchaeota archaeon]|nr:DUF362 domain-containing protein [Candidatus Bathyarchaeota archaeon]
MKYVSISALAGALGIFLGTFKGWKSDRHPPSAMEPPTKIQPRNPSRIGESVVSIVRLDSDDEIDRMVRKSLDAIGGLGRLVSPGKRVLVKPAVLTSDKYCAPDPRVVAAVVKLAREVGGNVTVAESSGRGSSTAYNLSHVGITSAAEEAGAEVKSLEDEKPVRVEVPSGVSLREVLVYPTVLNSDVLISVPRLKRHISTTVTISLKNMMGTIPNSEKGRFHTMDLSQSIADLNTVVRPDLSIIDGTSAMVRTGPTGGDMVKSKIIIASGDPVAADMVAAWKLQEIEGEVGVSSRYRFDATNIRHILAAGELGVGNCNLESIRII